MTSRAAAAVVRALDDRQREATEEVERILTAAVRVMQRVSPDAPRVSDIVAEAGVSNKAFYKYFAGKKPTIAATFTGNASMTPVILTAKATLKKPKVKKKKSHKKK